MTNELIEKVRTRKRLPDPSVRRFIRQRAGVSQGELGEAVGVSAASISRWETGEREPRTSLVERYVDTLDLLAKEFSR